MDLWSDTDGIFCAPDVISQAHTSPEHAGAPSMVLGVSSGLADLSWVSLDSEPSYSSSEKLPENQVILDLVDCIFTEDSVSSQVKLWIP